MGGAGRTQGLQGRACISQASVHAQVQPSREEAAGPRPVIGLLRPCPQRLVSTSCPRYRGWVSASGLKPGGFLVAAGMSSGPWEKAEDIIHPPQMGFPRTRSSTPPPESAAAQASLVAEVHPSASTSLVLCKCYTKAQPQLYFTVFSETGSHSVSWCNLRLAGILLPQCWDHQGACIRFITLFYFYVMEVGCGCNACLCVCLEPQIQGNWSDSQWGSPCAVDPGGASSPLPPVT